jgi:hypothetical protein
LTLVPAVVCAFLAAGCIGAGDVSAAPRARAEVLGKPVAPFSVRTQVLGMPSVGQPLEVRVVVRPSVPVTDLVLDAAGDASLEVAGSDARQSAPSATPSSPAEWTVSVVPLEEGELRLKITVDGLIDGVRQARSIVAPIRVGAQGASDKGASTGAPGAGAAADAGAGSEAKSSEPRAQGEGNDAAQGDGLIHLHSDE